MAEIFSHQIYSTSLATLVQSIFGCCQRVVCVVDEHDVSVFVKDACLLLQLLDIQHPVGRLLVAACTAQRKGNGSGVKSLVVMATMLMEVFQTLHGQGIPKTNIVTLMRQVLSECTDEVISLQVPVHRSVMKEGEKNDFQKKQFPVEKKILTSDEKYSTINSLSKTRAHQTQTVIKNVNKLFLSNHHDQHLPETKRNEFDCETEKFKMKLEQDPHGSDYVDWFFEEGKVHIDSDSRCQRTVRKLNTARLPLVSSLKETEQQDSDFDDCFEDEGGLAGCKDASTHSSSTDGLYRDNRAQTEGETSGSCSVNILPDHVNTGIWKSVSGKSIIKKDAELQSIDTMLQQLRAGTRAAKQPEVLVSSRHFHKHESAASTFGLVDTCQSDWSKHSMPEKVSDEMNNRTQDVSLETSCLSWKEVSHGLSRSCTGSMDLVIQAAETQMNILQSNQFNRRLLHVCSVPGISTKHSSVVHGLVFNCDISTVSDMVDFVAPVNLLLLNGDLSYSFHHTGYKSTVTGLDTSASLESHRRCLEESLDVLEQLSVDLILVRGDVSEEIRDRICSKHVGVISGVPARVLEAIKQQTQTEMTVYLMDVTQKHVCIGACVQPLLSSWCDSFQPRSKSSYVVISTPAGTTSALQTVVICHPCSHGNDIQEQEVDLCSMRVENVLRDGCVLPGQGGTEQHCAQYLQDKLDCLMDTPAESDPYLPCVMQEMKAGFLQIVAYIQCKAHSESVVAGTPVVSKSQTFSNSSDVLHYSENGANLSQQTCTEFICNASCSCLKNLGRTKSCLRESDNVFDNYKSKMAAWTLAMDTVAKIIATDAEIINGVESPTSGVFPGLMHDVRF